MINQRQTEGMSTQSTKTHSLAGGLLQQGGSQGKKEVGRLGRPKAAS